VAEGEKTNTITYTEGTGFKADNYNISKTEGKLKIKKRPVTFTGKTDTKEYTGSEIELTDITISSGENEGLVEGHTHNVAYSAKGKDVSVYPGTITAKESVIIKSGETVVTGNYDITTVAGKLTVTKAPAPDPSKLPDAAKPTANMLIAGNEEQELMTAPDLSKMGSTYAYTDVLYSTDNGQNWTKEVPTGKDTGAYKVKVKYTGDPNHEDLIFPTFTATIGTYKITSVSSSTWTKGSSATIKIVAKYLVKVDGADSDKYDTSYDHFEDLFVDGKQWTRGTDYTVKKGSTEVTMKAASLQKLSTGEHTVKLQYDNGSVETKITVKDAAAKSATDKPSTGDNSAPGLWCLTAVLSAAGAALMLRPRRRRDG
ncbi:MAG: hypothetical protein IKM88_01535, partial [Lachnospiraceae bacterium]|nr:hypothetical protein [Lachnospiraceae bacterium]